MVTETHVIKAFVNTQHKHPGREASDELSSAAEASAWLRAHGLLEHGRLSDAELERVLELREALRALLLANNGVEVDAAGAWAIVDRAARRGRLELRLLGGVPELAPAAAGVDGALARIVAALHAALVSGQWTQLKACRAHDCEWAFDDTSKNKTRAWCSMGSCGNREKARAYRRRHASAAHTVHDAETDGPAAA